MPLSQTIIHPTDFDGPSKEAFRVARSLAQALGARLVAFHVVPPPALVVGSHGRRGIRRLLWGSRAEEAVRECPCPVLVVKAPPPKSPAADPGATETAGDSGA